MPERVDTAVVGGGQAGLATSRLLTERGREHVLLERGRVGERWRSRVWDGFRLNTPNWTLRLPGPGYDGPDPDAFGPAGELVAYLERYADGLPVRTDVGVERLEDAGDFFRLTTTNGVVEAANVVVASGAFQAPHMPFASPPSGIRHVHSSEYHRPGDLPDGAVLVVGSGQSGCQIAEELVRAGRTVYLAVSRCPWAPRRYRGRDIVHWLIDIGMMDETVDQLASPEAILACNPTLTGNDDGHDCNPLTLEAEGAVLLGRLERLDDGRAWFGADLRENIVKGLEFVARLAARCDEYVARTGMDAPEPEPPVEDPRPDRPEPRELDLSGVSTVLWATGYRPDYGWIRLPVFGDGDRPLQCRGVTERKGLYFVGLHWLHKRKSALLFGVGEDAEYVVSHLAGDERRSAR